MTCPHGADPCPACDSWVSLEVCSDCALLIANGEATDAEGLDLGPALQAAWEASGLGNARLVLDGDDEEEPWFSWLPCDACRRPLAGARLSAGYDGRQTARWRAGWGTPACAPDEAGDFASWAEAWEFLRVAADRWVEEAIAAGWDDHRQDADCDCDWCEAQATLAALGALRADDPGHPFRLYHGVAPDRVLWIGAA